MSSSKKETTRDWYSKTREELSRTGDTWMALFPGSRRNTEENIKNGEDEYLPDPQRVFRILFVQNRVKYWFSARDLRNLLDLYNENKDAIHTDFTKVGRKAIEDAKALEKLFEE